MPYLISADWHLTDLPQDEYRWNVFKHLARAIFENKNADVFILGDITDRKDRHSAALVNRIITEFASIADLLGAHGRQAHIIMGNHDQPIRGVPFWNFLGDIARNLTFSASPTPLGKILMLPFASDPAEAWRTLDLSTFDVIFAHQPVDGARGNNGHVLEIANSPKFPRDALVYAGDIHTAQKVGPVQYVGAPHPVAFGDDYPCQMMLIDDKFKIAKVIPINTIQKLMLRISSVDELKNIRVNDGDQARVFFSLPLMDAEQWPGVRAEIAAWGKSKGVQIASIEAEIGARSRGIVSQDVPYLEPFTALAEFATAEGMAAQLLDAGRAMLREALDLQSSGKA